VPQATGLLDVLKAAIEDAPSALAREGALLVFSSLCQVVGKPAEPFLVPLLGNVLACYCDKVRSCLEYTRLLSWLLRIC